MAPSSRKNFRISSSRGLVLEQDDWHDNEDRIPGGGVWGCPLRRQGPLLDQSGQDREDREGLSQAHVIRQETASPAQREVALSQATPRR